MRRLAFALAVLFACCAGLAAEKGDGSAQLRFLVRAEGPCLLTVEGQSGPVRAGVRAPDGEIACREGERVEFELENAGCYAVTVRGGERLSVSWSVCPEER